MKKATPHLSRKPRSPLAPFSPGGMIVREHEPMNLEMPFGSLDGFITPMDRFFVRSHFSIPQIDVKTWRLKIEGEVETPLELGYEELLKMEMKTITATLECAGNGRAFLKPPPDATLWELGAVGKPWWIRGGRQTAASRSSPARRFRSCGWN